MGALFCGVMFFFDFQIALRGEGESVHAVLDLFPDPVGVLILLGGIFYLASREKRFASLRVPVLVLLPCSVFITLKNTLFFSTFYTVDGTQNGIGQASDLVMHLVKLVFLILLLSVSAGTCRDREENLLASRFVTARHLCVVQGVLMLAQRLLTLVLPETAKTVLGVLSLVAYLFWIALLWLCVITLVRMMLRLSLKTS